jgi:hypothetical protein
MGVDRRQAAKWLFAQWGPHGQVFVRGVEVKATLQTLQKVYVYPENTLVGRQPTAGGRHPELSNASLTAGGSAWGW